MTNGDDDASDESRPAEESEETSDEVNVSSDEAQADADPETDAAAEAAPEGDDGDASTEEGAEADTPTEESGEETADGAVATDVTAEDLEARLDKAAEDLETAETEADLDEVEAELDAVETDLEAADLPEPDEEEEDAEDPREALESRLSELRESLEAQRGPYAEDVTERVEEAATTVEETRWTESGEPDVAAAVRTFADRAGEILGEEFTVEGGERDRTDGDAATDGGRAADADDAAATDSGTDTAALAETLRRVAGAVESRSLHPDEDAETIADLLEAVEQLESDLDAAEEWDDLETNERLDAQGYYDVVGHYKDYPPELAALKEHEKRGNVEMVLLALDSLASEFMEEHCMEALIRMNDPAAFDEMHRRAQKRNRPAIKALGHMGSGAGEAVETLIEYVDADSDRKLQKVTFRALGEIGDERATQPLANKLASDSEVVRSIAARALGLLGDARAVDPLTDVLTDDDADEVRASAAWALRQIGTESALEAAAEAADDRSYLVQSEAERAEATLGREADARSARA